MNKKGEDKIVFIRIMNVYLNKLEISYTMLCFSGGI